MYSIEQRLLKGFKELRWCAVTGNQVITHSTSHTLISNWVRDAVANEPKTLTQAELDSGSGSIRPMGAKRLLFWKARQAA